MIHLLLLLLVSVIPHLPAGPSGFTMGAAQTGLAANTSAPDGAGTIITESEDTLPNEAEIPEEYTELRNRLNTTIAVALGAQSSAQLADLEVITEEEVTSVIALYPEDDDDLATLRTNLELSRTALTAYFALVEQKEARLTAAQAAQDYEAAQALASFTTEEEHAVLVLFAAAPPLATLLQPDSGSFHRSTLDAAKQAVNPLVTALQLYYQLITRKAAYLAAAQTITTLADLPAKPTANDLQEVQRALEQAQMHEDTRYIDSHLILSECHSIQDAIERFFAMKAEAIVPAGGFVSSLHELPSVIDDAEQQRLVTLLEQAGLSNRIEEIRTAIETFNTAVSSRRDQLVGVTDEAVNRLTSVIALEGIGNGNALRIGPSSTTSKLELRDEATHRQLIFAAQSSDGVQIHLIDARDNEYRLLLNAEGIYRIEPLITPDGVTVTNANGTPVYEHNTQPFNTSLNFSQHPDDGTLHDSAYQLEIRHIAETVTTPTTDDDGEETEHTSQKVHIIIQLTQQLRDETEYGTSTRRANVSFAMDVAEGSAPEEYLPTHYRIGSNATTATVEMLSELPEPVEALPTEEEEEETVVVEPQAALDSTTAKQQLQQGGYFGRSPYGRRGRSTVR